MIDKTVAIFLKIIANTFQYLDRIPALNDVIFLAEALLRSSPIAGRAELFSGDE